MRTGTWRRWGRAALVGLALIPAAIRPAAATAQEYARAVVQEDSAAALVAVSIRFPTGSAADPEGEEGTAHVAAEALAAEANRRLHDAESRVEATVARDEFLVTLVAPRPHWSAALGELERLLDSPELPDPAVQALLERHGERLVFQEGAPVRAFEIERLRLLLGASAPGARPAAGTPASVERISPGGPAAFIRRHVARAGASVAVVGAVPEAEAEMALGAPVERVSALGAYEPASAASEAGAGSTEPGESADERAGGDGARTAVEAGGAAETAGTSEALGASAALPDAPLLRLRPPPFELSAGSGSSGTELEGTASTPPWSTPDRFVVDRNFTSTWIAVAWPFDPAMPRQLLEFLGRVLHEEVVGSPPGPGFFEAHPEVADVDGAPVLLFSATVDPRTAVEWEQRILDGLRTVAESPPAGAFFELGRRRHRAAVLLEQATLDGRSRWLARTAARRGEIPDLHADLWSFTRDVLAEAAGSAGPPRVLLVGPAGMMEEGGSPAPR